MTTAIRGSEVRLVARSKGWKGKSNTPKEEVIKWLEERGVRLHDIAGIVASLRGFASGRSLPGQAAPIAPGMLRADVERMVEERLAKLPAGVDEKLIGRLIAEAVSKAQPARIILEEGRKPVKLNKRTHPMFEKVRRLVKSGVNVLLIGPAGCGKTTLAEHLAESMERRYGTLHCTAGASESQLTGWLLPIGKNGEFEYVPSEFVRLYEGGNSLFLIDEIDAADPNMLLILNSALANGALHVPQRYRSPHVKRGKDTAIIAAANTFGTGADMLYAGRNQLDAATLDRFYPVRLSYDPALESELIGQPVATLNTWQPANKADLESDLATLADWITKLRASVEQHALRRVVSTRTYMKAVAARSAGIPAEEIRSDLLTGWTRDELVKVGAA